MKRELERLEKLEAVVQRLREEAEYGTIVVEGSRDVAALEWLGIGGQHIALHQGRTLPEVIEDLALCPPPVILLVDWDRTGGRLLKVLADNLRARVRLDLDTRKRLSSCCHARSLEEVPAELSSLRDQARVSDKWM